MFTAALQSAVAAVVRAAVERGSAHTTSRPTGS
ncbi:hypothetical protein [Streptomyces sp. cg35]